SSRRVPSCCRPQRGWNDSRPDSCPPKFKDIVADKFSNLRLNPLKSCAREKTCPPEFARTNKGSVLGPPSAIVTPCHLAYFSWTVGFGLPNPGLSASLFLKASTPAFVHFVPSKFTSLIKIKLLS